MRIGTYLMVILICTAVFAGTASAIGVIYVGYDKADISWSQYVGDDFGKYVIYADSSPVDTIYDQSETRCRADGLTTDRVYNFEVEYYDKSDKLKSTDSKDIHIGQVHGTLRLGDDDWNSIDVNMTGDIDLYGHELSVRNSNVFSGPTSNQYYYPETIKGSGDLMVINSQFTNVTVDVTLNDSFFSGMSANQDIKFRCSEKTFLNITAEGTYNGNPVSFWIIGDSNTVSDCGGFIKAEGDNNHFEDNNCMIIQVSGESPVITGNTVGNSVYDNYPGISTENGNNTVISGNIVSGIKGTGINLYTDKNPLIVDNVISDCRDRGIYISSPYLEEIINVTLINNTVSRTGSEGFRTWDPVSGGEFSRNLFSDLGNIGLRVDGTDLLVKENRFVNCSYAGMSIHAVSSEFTGNYADKSSMEIYGNDGWWSTIGYNSVRDNIVSNTREGYIGLDAESDNSTVINNTVSWSYEGISCEGFNITVAKNTVTNNLNSGITLDAVFGNISGNTLINNSNFNNVYYGGIYINSGNNLSITDNTVDTAYRCMYFDGGTDGTTVEKNIISNGSGIYVSSSGPSDFTVRDNIIKGSSAGFGIALTYIDEAEITDNEISNFAKGITLFSVNGTLIENNNITQTTTSGIEFGPYTETYGGCYLNEISDNSVESKNTGIKVDAKNTTVTSNTVTGYTQNGIYLTMGEGTNISSNILKKNTSYNPWDLYINTEEGLFQDTLTLDTNTIGVSNPTNLTFSNISDCFAVMSVEDPPEPPKPPEYNTTRTSIGKWAQVYNLSTELELDIEFHYTDEEIEGYNESSLWVWKHNGTTWDEGNPDDWESWDNKHWVNPERNIVGASIYHCCIFAPLTGKPVHNPRLEADYMSIKEALDDFEFTDGDTITVDTSYTGTKENINIYKEVRLKSSSGKAASVTITADDPYDPAIKIFSDNVEIDGFVITGAAFSYGLKIEGCEVVKVSNCKITGNSVGASLAKSEIGTPEKSEYCTISYSEFSGNSNCGVYINDSDENNVFDCEIKDPIGIAIENGISGLVSDCTFSGNSEYGVVVQHGGSVNEIMSCEFTDTENGIYLYDTEKNTFSGLTFKNTADTVINAEDSDRNTFSDISSDSFGSGAYLKNSDSNSFTDCEFKGNSDGFVTGFEISGSESNTIENCNIHDIASVGYSVDGFKIYGDSDSNSISNSSISGFESSKCTGITLTSGSGNIIENVTVSGLSAAYGGAYGLKLTSGPNIVKNSGFTGISATNNSYGWILNGDYGNTLKNSYLNSIASPNVSAGISAENFGYTNSLSGITFAGENATTFSMKGKGNMTFGWALTPPPDGDDLINIGHYLDINGDSGSELSLEVNYSAGDLGTKDPNLLSMWHYKGDSWVKLPQPNGVDTAAMYTYADNITEFSVFAPMWNGYIPNPVANFTAAPLSGAAIRQVNFTDLSTESPHTWSWNFGDGNTSSVQNPVHNYTVNGTYTVSLTVTNDGGSDTMTKTDYITVYKKGDFNGNGVVDIGDVSKVAYMVAGLTHVDMAADFNENGEVDTGDAARIAWYFVGKISEL
ncbi:right-handed parallel beta-helix repeat-containing protein [Methanoplanus endosymbiosus]|uniref:Probable pectate lyase C n=1 Tax=Methanoplanus endosymbiosus TaxID=33865 RepID=A0A9E7TLQ1_9EURY|nr:right-handed parallel beta-helix repeat-containing protein [Methanoplanus endosymbiosus]UUX92596.1 right-handed parallel beta-helix repeat-containing protein [Methanoplanus endosymbiosus]